MTATRVLVTGADGFVGRAVVAQLQRTGHEVVPVSRSVLEQRGAPKGDLVGFAGWQPLLEGCTAVVHLAARAHVLREREREPLDEFRRVNVKGTLQLATAAVRSGARRFVFVSSVGVHGSRSTAHPWSETDAALPVEPYAISKREAELELQALARLHPFELTIVRPPLAYGPYVRGNMLRLLSLVAKGWPLPFGAVDNHRSFVGVDNLAAFLELCAVHPAAAGEIFLVSDEHDVSTPELMSEIARGLHRALSMPGVPPAALRTMAGIARRGAELERLIGNLQVDARRARDRLGWRPPVSFEQGIATMTQWYREAVRR